MDEREFKVGVALWAVFLLVVFPICWPFWKIKDWWDGRRAAPAAGVDVPARPFSAVRDCRMEGFCGVPEHCDAEGRCCGVPDGVAACAPTEPKGGA